MPTIERRLDALERKSPQVEPLLIVRRLVTPGFLDVYPPGIASAPPHLPAVDRLPGESWDAFTDRLAGMIAHLPAGSVVQVVSRDATDCP